MIITEINQQKKKGRYNLYIDGSFYGGVDAETIVKNGIKVGMEIDQVFLENVIIESETRLAFEKLLNLISRQMYSKKDLELKLFNKGFSKIVVDRAVAKAEEYGYIDDQLYAKLLVESKPLKSKREIKNALFLKGLSSNIIEDKICKIDEEEETSRAKVISEKYIKNKEINEKTMSGLYAYLARRGFNSGSISKVLRMYKYEVEE